MTEPTPIRSAAAMYCREVDVLINQIGMHRISDNKQPPFDLVERIETAMEFDPGDDTAAFSAKVSLKRAVRAAGIR